MASRRAELVARNYRERLHALRAEVARRLGIAYAKVIEDDIRASFAAFAPLAARTITAGQASAQTLTRAYIRGIGVEPLTLPSLAGTTKAGTMAEGLAGIAPLILISIAKGASASDAVLAGGGYVDRLADNELTRVVDAEVTGQAGTGKLRGWQGITYGASDECTSNEGFHSFGEDMVRHPHCQCDRELVVA